MNPPPPGAGDVALARRNVFRMVNLEIRRLSRRWSTDAPFDALCECDDVACSVALSVDGEVFDAVAEQPGRLLVAAEHRSAPGERVVARYRDALVVERAA